MERNIKVSYVLSFLKHSWFWIGIWVFYYLRYTNYSGIGLIETVMIATMTLTEIPTGAIGDLVGRKMTLFIALFLESVGNFIMAYSPNFEILVFSVFIMSLGGTMYSGTSDALAYDSLKAIGKEKDYDKVVANMNSMQWIAVAVTGIIGGFLYKVNPSYPFIAAGLFYALGSIATFLLREPAIDTLRFSFTNFLKQNRDGFKELFKSVETRRIIIFLIGIGSMIILSWEMLEGVLGVEFGFDPVGFSILSAVMYLLSALGSQMTKIVSKLFGYLKGIIIMSVISIISFLPSPYIGIVLGGITLATRSIVQVIIQNLSLVIVNRNTESRYRATAISSFNMLKNMPYFLSAYALGVLMDIVTAKMFAFYLGMIFAIWILVFIFAKKSLSIEQTR